MVMGSVLADLFTFVNLFTTMNVVSLALGVCPLAYWESRNILLERANTSHFIGKAFILT